MSRKKRDYILSLIFILLFLLGFGLVMIYSTSSYTAALEFDGDGLYYFKKQLFAVILGLVMMFVLAIFPYKFYRNLGLIAYIVGLLSLLLILTPLGYEANGARRWISVAGISLQPAEIAKVAIVIFTASFLAEIKPEARSSWKAIFTVLIPAGIYCGFLFGVTKNLSSAIIVGGMAYFILLLSSDKKRNALIILFAVALAGALVFFLIIKGVGSWGFRGERILAWLNPEKYADGKGFQTLQSLYGIGSGGFFGKGLGKSIQKLGFLPFASNDMIFAIICEELGLFGGLAVIILFVFLLLRMKTLTENVRDPFGNMLVVGIFAQIAIQVILNIAVVTNTIPNTGISLPFISYGGTSVAILLAEMGIVFNVALNADFSDMKKPMKKKRPENNPNEARG